MGKTLNSSKVESSVPAMVPAVVAMQISHHIIYREIIPHYTDYYLKDYPFRIVKTSSGAVFTDSGAFPEGTEPELTIPLRGTLLIDGHFYRNDEQGEQTETPPESVFEQYRQEDPSVRFWLQRFLSMRELSRDFLLAGGEWPEAEYILEIFYPGRPVDDLVRAQLWSNMGVSLGILILLVASMMVLLRFYRNTEKLREMEQEFVASMSHELRTPIAVLQSTSENLKKGVVTDTSRLSRYGTIIHREVKRLSRTVEGILLYSGLEKRSWNGLKSASMDLGKLVQDVVESLQEPAKEVMATISVHQNIPDHRIITDPTGLRLIMENLIINAIRHGLPKPEDTGTPKEIRLYVKAQLLGRELSIKVEDNGSGIPAKEARNIFDPFVRSDASVSAQRPGSGLGLHLVKQVVKILGGTVSLESPYQDLTGRDQPGCRFSVLLPIQQEETSERKGADN